MTDEPSSEYRGPGSPIDEPGGEHGPPPASLKRRASVGALWTLGGYAVGEVLRLGSNLVLTRILFPEAFGLMALVTVFLRGLQMFSDVGVRGSVIQNKRGTERAFTETAWTVQVLRGGLLWVACLACAIPFASFYGQSALAVLLPISGLAALLSGFNSIRLATADRAITLGRVTLIELGSQCVAIAVMVTWAVLWPSVWALVAGGVAMPLVRMVSSHLFLPGDRDRFGWDTTSAREIFGFGVWIFISTLLSFFLQQGDKLILGKLLDPAALGVYAIATLWAGMTLNIGNRLGRRVIFPALAEVTNLRRHALRDRLRRARLVYLAVLLPVTCAIAVFGDLLVEWLYDARYHDAGWVIRLLAPGFASAVIAASNGNVLLALGDSFRNMIVQVVRGVLMIICMAGGWSLGGLPGLLVGVSVARVIDYPAFVWGLRRHGVWLWKFDCGVYVLTALVVALGWAVFPPQLP